jgi:hypothetical protein
MVRVIALWLLVLVLGASAPAGGRVALVIGNGDYANAGKLANPVNDAEDVAAKLRELGFTVVDGYNLGKRDLETRIGDFADALDGASAGLFYYAGHGIQVAGRNYIVPTDAHLDVPAKLKLESIPIDDVMDLMQQQAGTAILILDACRNNPFARGLGGGQATTRGVTAAEGLAQIDGAKGTFIAFSTAPGAVAMDGTGRNSPFAEALLKHMGEPGQSINDLMIAVRRDVVAETKDFQTPMSWDSLTDRFAFVAGDVVSAKSLPQSVSGSDGNASTSPLRGVALYHNGSVMEFVARGGREFSIVYDVPRPGLAVSRRDPMFSGKLVSGTWDSGLISGDAFVYRKGCDPLGYSVTGVVSNERPNFVIELRGAAPRRKGCKVVGYDQAGPNGVLVVETGVDQ